ncbi:MAG: response regulator transcription factor [Prolixibacteraceae bacterium]|jgi:DNA-binding response OmpR family regulator|nr:response regulator transcription factor [Prolixibacteraceae bacterium]
MEQKIRILLVEDDQSLGFLMTEFLSSKGFEVTLCKDGISGWNTYNTQQFQFAVLDVMLPGLDGFSLAKNIRESRSGIPIILVTARSMKEDKIKGFNLGIDDYITKPFDEDELFCRIQAILNRIDSRQVADKKKIQLGKYSYEFQNQSLNINNESRRLTARENAVLYLLIQNSGQIVKRELILNNIWGTSDYFSGRSLDVYISKLRKYMQDDSNIVIENIPKVGFLFQVKTGYLLSNL